MKPPTSQGAPRLSAVATEQFRVVGLAVRREGALALLILAIPTLLGLVTAWVQGRALGYGGVEELTILGWWTGAVAFFLPVIVWKGERAFGDSPLWCLPVAHRQHLLIKVAAGAAWLLIAVTAVLLWLVLLTVLSGGSLNPEATRNLVDAAAPLGYRAATTTTPAWQWIAPLTGGLAVYMLGSALHLGTRRPWWWLAGTVVTAGVLSTILPETGIAWLERGWDNLLQQLTMGRLGLDALLAGGVEGLEAIHRVPDQLAGVNVWVALPTIGRWVGATALWFGLGLAALLAASHRPRHG